MRELRQDVAYALRSFRRQPGFALVAILTLTLGISANTAIFSVVNTVVLRPLKAPDEASLVRFITTTGASTSIAGAQSFDVWRQQRAVFEDVSAHRLEYVNLTEGSEPEQTPVARVTAEFFRLFRAPVLTGRTFTASEDRAGGPLVAVLSYALWTRRFQNDPAVLGRRVSLGNVPYVVVGVLSPEFDTEQFDPQPDVWVPFQLDARRVDAGNLFTVTGRLTAGTTRAAANAQLAVAVAASRRCRPVVTHRVRQRCESAARSRRPQNTRDGDQDRAGRRTASHSPPAADRKHRLISHERRARAPRWHHWHENAVADVSGQQSVPIRRHDHGDSTDWYGRCCGHS